ncbi:MAG: AAA family ATPase [Planctomycetales bacterium]|nr:AAA family ATPase [Planctomycetales bacterium]
MIERLYVQNFRCLESLTLDLSDCSSALLVGRNGTGKSAIRSAMAVLQRIGRGSSRVGQLISPSDFSFNRIDRPMRFELEATVAGKRYQYDISFEWPDHFREARILDEKVSVDGINVFARHHSQVRLGSEAEFGLDWHVFALPVINDSPPTRSLQQLKDYLASIVLLTPIPRQMNGFSSQPSVELVEDASNFASCLRALFEKKPAAYGAFDEAIRELIPDFEAIENVERGKDGRQLMVTFGGPGGETSFTIEFDALSDGEKCFFIAAYLQASIAAGFPVVCMWDEPDNHLSMSEIGHLIATLRRSSRRGGQFIATSHHPETVRRFSDENTIVLTRRSHLDPTIPKLLSDICYEGDLVDAMIRDEVVG